MIRAITPVAALLLGVAILLTGQGLQGILLPVRATMEQFSTVAVGLIGGAYFFGFTFGCWRGAALIRRAGHVHVFAAMTAIASAAPLLHGLWVNMWSWGILRLVSGFCFAVLYVVIESWLNEASTNENRGKVFSAYIFINMTVLAVGQQMLLLEDPMDLHLFAMASVLVSLAAVPVVLSKSKTPRKVKDSRFDIKALYRNSPAGMLGCLATGFANGAFWSLAPVFTAAYSQDVKVSAWFMTAGVLGGAAGQWPLGWLSDRIDRRYVMAGASVAGIGIALCMWLLAGQLPVSGIIALGVLWGAMAFPIYSVSVAHANDWAHPDTYVQISSGLLLMYGVGAITGPVIASGIMTVTSASGLFLFTGIVHALLALYVVARRKARQRTRQFDQIEFSDALTSAMTASNEFSQDIDPDALASEARESD